MPVCDLSESEEEALTEITSCTKCTFEASTEEELDKHLEDVHTNSILNTLN